MDIVKIVFISSIVFPLLATVSIMFWVRASIVKLKRKNIEASIEMKLREDEFIEKVAKDKRLIKTLERVVDSQDRILDVYREEKPF